MNAVQEEIKYKDFETNRFKSMTAEQKLNLSLQLYYSAKELKRSWLKMQHIDWTDQQIESKLREIFLYART